MPDEHPIPVRDKAQADQAWVDRLLTERWGGRTVLLRGGLVDAGVLPALVAGDRLGLATFTLSGDAAELITLDAVQPSRGVGTALVEALWARLGARAGRRLRVTTTNDNLEALRFYQRRGFRLVGLRPGAVERGRRLKPSIPRLGCHGIPIRDEIELERAVP
jgi:ribosomal protein S18 acetylase RimI-like enzyme